MPGKKKKGLSMSERKDQYLNPLQSRQQAVRDYQGDEYVNRGLREAYDMGYNPTDANVRTAVDNAAVKSVNSRFDKPFSNQVQAEAKRFDKATQYDELLGRSTNPATVTKFNMFTKGGNTSSMNKNNSKK